MSMDREKIERIVLKILEQACGREDIAKKKELDLIKSGYLDSLAFIELIDMLEETFDIEIYPTQVEEDTWKNVENIVKMVEHYLEKV